jgi:hypothetical protein
MPSVPQDSGSPLREMLRDVSGVPYRPLSTLADAQKEEDGYVVLEGDDGGMIYVVALACVVKAGEDALGTLLQDLDEIAWSGGQPDMRRMYFEKRQPGAVPGGMGGAHASAQIWIHREFGSIEKEIMAVLHGEKAPVAHENDA